ncbi:MAG TPA: PTS sugar transporter subunit IIA [Rhodothermales bacterium]|nr:PTS sugar transporter subunit IIA [Rhodothermales bacterium]HRR08120.1 PTS sugar transporter subunit IIA [Rhodothermales bacterium]
MPKEITPISTYLSPDHIQVKFVAPDKNAAIERLLSNLEGHPAVSDLSAVSAAIFKRESVMSTGVGKCLALPHAKTDAVSGIAISLGIAEEGIPFESIDDQPVRILLLMVAPTDAALQHIRLLGHVSRLMNRETFRNRLLHAPDTAAVLRYFEEEEERMREE